MTVAAVVLARTAASALADADGLPAVRRIVDVAWAGGAVPIVVVAEDPDGGVARALAGAPVTLAEPAPDDAGPAGQVRRGVDVAVAAVTGTQGALVWPVRFSWVGPETVTSLIEASGAQDPVLLRPAYEGEPGWPVLVPLGEVARLANLPPGAPPDPVMVDVSAVGLPVRTLELGDPGAVHDRSTPRAELPPYVGPTQPAAGHVHEWGAAIADQPEDGPLEGPALAPYGQAVAENPDQPG